MRLKINLFFVWLSYALLVLLVYLASGGKFEANLWGGFATFIALWPVMALLLRAHILESDNDA